MRVLAISAHPDDETLGCGGTLLKHRAAGDELHWLVATERCSPVWPDAAVVARRRQLQHVTEAYGFATVTRLGHLDTGLDVVPLSVLVDGVLGAVRAARPEVVYVVHGGDVHSDHVRVHDATAAALKSWRMTTLGVRSLLAYETLSSTDSATPLLQRAFLPNVYCDISAHLSAKWQIMAQYDTELQDAWLPRTESATTALARTRGATIGVEFAEAFMLLREIR